MYRAVQPEQREALMRIKLQVIKETGIPFNKDKWLQMGIAVHHAGMTVEERAVIEAGYRDGHIRVLSTTSTLAAGVNLPAQRVIVRTGVDFRSQPVRVLPVNSAEVSCIDVVLCDAIQLSTQQYVQMAGRAGRTNASAVGECFLVNHSGAYLSRQLGLLGG